MKVTKITLEDNGQDFLTFYVDKIGRIIDAKPFQISLWVGGVIPVWSRDLVKPGELCPMHKPPYINYGLLKHKIEAVEEVEYDPND